MILREDEGRKKDEKKGDDLRTNLCGFARTDERYDKGDRETHVLFIPAS